MRAFCPPKNTPDKDIVMTPEYLAKEIIEHYNPIGRILDPCREVLSMITSILMIKIGVNFAEEKDFLEYNEKVDWIITNPPWSKMQKFLAHGQIADNIVYLTTINHYTTKRRIRDMREAGFALKEIYNVPTPKKAIRVSTCCCSYSTWMGR